MADPWGFKLDIKPGDRIASVGLDGVMRTGKISSVVHTPAQPARRIQPTGWRKVARALTPKRWRKPLPMQPPTPPTISFRTDDPFWR